jgi:hypothetical protein
LESRSKAKCAIFLYINESDEVRLNHLLGPPKKPMFMVSEIENSVMCGAIIKMRIVIKKIHLAMHLESAKSAYLTISFKLLLGRNC